MDPSNRSSRGASRFLAGLPAVIHLPTGDRLCSAHNLSRTGVLLSGEISASPGPIEVTVRTVTGDLQIRIHGQVHRVDRDEENGTTEVGVGFAPLDDETRERLESMVARVIEGQAPASLQALSANPTDQEIRDALASVSLAHRISLALRAMSREREILMRDPSPQVLDALARNPSLLSRDVRALLRSFTLLPSTLETFARDARWNSDEELRILIASHPRTPMAAADRVIDSLDRHGLERLVQRPGLNAALRLKVGHRLKGPPGRR